MATKENGNADLFSKLYSLNVNDKVESKNGLSYLSWAFAWAEFKKVYPDANYKIERDPVTNLPYFTDETGLMVFTEVTAGGLTYQMWLPVMDGANKAMKKQPYSYKTKYGDKWVDAATMFDVNKTIMRCLVKNLAMFGLGLYIYAGDDLPEMDDSKLLADINACTSIEALEKIYKQQQVYILKNADLLQAVKDKKAELTAK